MNKNSSTVQLLDVFCLLQQKKMVVSEKLSTFMIETEK